MYLFFYCALCLLYNCVYCDMYDARCWDFALSANFVLKGVLMSVRCKNKKGSESIVQKEIVLWRNKRS